MHHELARSRHCLRRRIVALAAVGLIVIGYGSLVLASIGV